jgi:sulfopyruvate decarboxylase TPP-binding subunit
MALLAILELSITTIRGYAIKSEQEFIHSIPGTTLVLINLTKPHSALHMQLYWKTIRSEEKFISV